MINKIHNCNNMDLLKTISDNSVDLLLTDVPYGLQDIDALKLIKENQNNTCGFMNKAWDVIPTTEMLTEFNRVLKYGGFFVTTFTARSDLQTVFQYRLLEAGFDISFSPILWNYQCLSEDSEIFTKQYGWINLKQLLTIKKDTSIYPINKINILVYDRITGQYKWEIPQRWSIYHNKDTAYRIKSNHTDQLVSQGHNCLVEQNGKLLYATPEELENKGILEIKVPYLDELPKMSKIYIIKNYMIKDGDGKVCSVKCRLLYVDYSALIYKNIHNKGIVAKWTLERKIAQSLKMIAEKNHAWKGGVTYRNRKGLYVKQSIKYVKCPKDFLSMSRKDGYVMEHRLLVAIQIQRPLTRTECVHHINRNAEDNRIENLMLFKTNAEHKKYENGQNIKPLWHLLQK